VEKKQNPERKTKIGQAGAEKAKLPILSYAGCVGGGGEGAGKKKKRKGTEGKKPGSGTGEKVVVAQETCRRGGENL